jgi:cellulose synthase/poly-beta-1,6-N-acetylglucosamine synthase-like glycosyltransferase
LTLVSITVCARNAEKWVDDCLLALISQDYRPIEIISVDDGSSDGTLNRMIEFRDSKIDGDVEITVIGTDAHGLSSGRNIALESAKGKWVAITDIDCRPKSNWISEMMSVSNDLNDENIVAVTGRTEFEEGKTRISRLRAKSIARKYAQRPRNVTLANGPCSMFRKDALISIGGFDPSWYHAEDMEVSLKLIQNGGNIIYAPEAMVRHVAEEGLLLFLRKRCRDARAHVRIVRRFGFQGIRNSKGEIMKHDFSSDANRIVFLFPLMLIGLSMCVFGLYVRSPQFWWSIVIPPLFLLILLRWKWPEILWSVSLWYGALFGLSDAILSRKGH